jgi:hypothetical protein
MPDFVEERGYAGQTYVAVYRPAAAGTEHAKNGGSNRFPGTVLIVPTIGDERRSLVRVEVEMARAAASNGFLAVRFDFSGDGASPRLRSLDAMMDDMASALSLAEVRSGLRSLPLNILAFRAGLCLLGRFLENAGENSTYVVDGACPVLHVFAIGPVTGAEFMRETSRRASLRSMLTSGRTAGGSDEEILDYGGDAYPKEFERAFAEPLRLPPLSGRILAVDIGPQKAARKDAADALRPFLAAGLKPSSLRRPPSDMTHGGADGIILWRHPVIWGEVEHSPVRPLEETFAMFLAEKE